MRFVRSVAVASVLLACLSVVCLSVARGEERGGALPAAGECPVAANAAAWTKQEAFVWAKVCVGAVADLAAEHDLDKVLTSRFIETILVDPTYAGALTRFGVRIAGAEFDEPLDLRNADLHHDFSLERTTLKAGADLFGLRSTRQIAFLRTAASGMVSFEASEIGGHLTLESCQFTELWLRDAHVAKVLNLSGSAFSGNVDMQRLKVGQGLLMRDAQSKTIDMRAAEIDGQIVMSGAKFVSEDLVMSSVKATQLFMDVNARFQDIDLSGAKIADMVKFTGSHVSGLLNLNRIDIGGSAVLSGEAEFKIVNLAVARIGSYLDISHAKVTGLLNMDSIDVKEIFTAVGSQLTDVEAVDGAFANSFSLNDATVTGRLDLNGVHVAENLLMENAKLKVAGVNLVSAQVGKVLSLSGMRLEGSVAMARLSVGLELAMQKADISGNVSLRNAHVGTQLSLFAAKVGGILDLASCEIGAFLDLGGGAEFAKGVNLSLAKIKENILLRGGRFHDKIDASSAHIEGGFELGSGANDAAQWIGDATLILANANADVIPNLADAWPPKFNLNGMVYRTLRSSADEIGQPINVPPPAVLETWLGRQIGDSTQVYAQLAQVFDNHGASDTASDIRYLGKQKERRNAGGLAKAGMLLLEWVIGYGYHSERAVGFAVVLVLLGAAVLRVSGQGPRNHMPYGLSYSFDMLLPIIHLREANYQIDLTGWARYYFYAHKLLGYIIASFLAVGLAGLTK